MDRLQNILVGIDFSEGSKQALVEAVRISRWHPADLHLLHVVEKRVVEDLANAYDQDPDEVRESMRGRLEEELNKLLSQAQPSGETHVHVAFGQPLEGILAAVAETSADLLVVGSSGSSKHTEYVGVVAMKCARKAPTKVLVVRRPTQGGFRKAVAAVDLSDLSSTVLTQAARVAKSDNAEVDVVHAFSPPWRQLHYMAPTPSTDPDFRKQFKRALHMDLEALVDSCQEELSSVTVNRVLLEAPYMVDSIVEYAREQEADLIVIGNRGDSSFKYLFMGTNAEKMLHETDVSVLVVKAPDFALE